MIDEMTITNAKYVHVPPEENVLINATVDGEFTSIPIDSGNRVYRELMRQVNNGDITIAAADPVGEAE